MDAETVKMGPIFSQPERRGWCREFRERKGLEQQWRISWPPGTALRGTQSYPHFTEDKTERQRGEVTGLRFEASWADEPPSLVSTQECHPRLSSDGGRISVSWGGRLSFANQTFSLRLYFIFFQVFSLKYILTNVIYVFLITKKFYCILFRASLYIIIDGFPWQNE